MSVIGWSYPIDLSFDFKSMWKALSVERERRTENVFHGESSFAQKRLTRKVTTVQFLIININIKKANYIY